MVVTKPLRIKIISMGNAEVGKSCLIKRYCEKRFIAKVGKEPQASMDIAGRMGGRTDRQTKYFPPSSGHHPFAALGLLPSIAMKIKKTGQGYF